MRRVRRAHERHARAKAIFKRRVVVTGAVTAVSLVGGAGVMAGDFPAGDRHQTIVTADADRDLLADREEAAIGYQPFEADQNRNTFQDGAELAARCAAVIGQPGPHLQKQEVLMFGLERCDICGELVNMGYIRLVNAQTGLQVELPFVALHYMEHGSFNYAGELHKGRLDVPVLLRTLDVRFPAVPNEHQLPLDLLVDWVGPIAPDARDLDGDLLTDSEELGIDLNLYSVDQNANLIPDGPELARRCAEAVERLPTVAPDATDAKGAYKVSFMMRGIEYCETCGESVNMGYYQVINSTLGSSTEVPFIALHYMEHGSLNYSGTVHTVGRVDIVALWEILGLPARCDDLGALLLPADLNGDCVVDARDLAALAEWWLDSTRPDLR